MTWGVAMMRKDRLAERGCLHDAGVGEIVHQIPPAMASSVTLKTLARRAGLSVAAVSYALRGSPKVAPATVARVRALAERSGYRPNARVAELMTQIRTRRPPGRGDVLALVWLEAREGERDSFGRAVLDGATRQAARRGFLLESFWLEEVDHSPRRLASILRARGVAGVVFAPVRRRTRVELDWPWDEFPLAVVGMAEWNQPVSRAGHHHFEAMRRALRELAAAGARRPACWLNRADDERAHSGWRAAWLASDVPGAARRIRLAAPGEETRAARRDWLARLRPDALVVSQTGELDELRGAGWSGSVERTVLLSWRAGAGAMGIDQGYDAITESAVDLVVTQLRHNERGLPDPPRMLLFPGHWRAGERADAAGGAA